MGAASLVSSLFRRFVLFCVVFLWSPLAYVPEKGASRPQPMAVMPAVARSIVEPNPNEEIMNATVAEHFLIVALIPGMLIRTPLPAWSKENATILWEKLQEEAVTVSLSKAKWYENLEQRDYLVGASWACAVGSFLLVFSRKPHSATFACALLNVGLVLFTVIACYFNQAKPTPQAVAALLSSLFESRAAAAWSARIKSAEKAAAGKEAKSESAGTGGASAAAASKKPSKKSKKAD